MSDAPRIAPLDVYQTAKVVEALGDDLTLKQAHALTVIVLRHDGGPLPRRGKKAPTDAVTISVLERRGYLNRGGEQLGPAQYVDSVRNHSPGEPQWTARSSRSSDGRMTAVIRASEEGRDLVSTAWEQRMPGRGSEPAERVGQGWQRSLDLPGVQSTDLFDSQELAEQGARESLQSADPSTFWTLLAEATLNDVLAGGMHRSETIPAFDETGVPLVPPEDHIIDAAAHQFGAFAESSPLGSRLFTVAITGEIPDCDMRSCGLAARYDMRLRNGGWANLCPLDARTEGLVELGTGMGAFLMHPDEIRSESIWSALRSLGIDEAIRGSDNPSHGHFRT